MNCPRCGKEMVIKSRDTSYSKSKREYNRTVYWCETDDAWIKSETPIEVSEKTARSEKSILQVGVKALLKNNDGKYLLLRRSAEKYPEVVGRWDTVGGRIDPGTTLLENLKREIREETGLELEGTPELIGAQDIIRNPERHVVRLTYLGQADGKVVLDPNEHDDYRWYDWAGVLELEDMDSYFRELLESQALWSGRKM